ncbi:MAG: prephenate dehydrogenase/arogenate dehydrogenase family protein, partial [Beijerinckiaceae bacterium]
MGLIGTSIARAARRAHAAARIVAIDRDEKVAARVRELGIADAVETDAARGVAGCDGVILCVPVGANGAVAQQIAAHLQAGAILSDVGSVKGCVVRDVQPHVPAGVHFIPGHPVAGTEQSGPDAGFATLFINRWHILTPDESVDAAALEKLKAFWEALGA